MDKFLLGTWVREETGILNESLRIKKATKYKATCKNLTNEFLFRIRILT